MEEEDALLIVCILLIAGIAGYGLYTWGYSNGEDHVRTNHPLAIEERQLIAQCEQSLPRDQRCKVVLDAVIDYEYQP